MTSDEIKTLIAAKYSVEEIIDILDITPLQILEAFEDELEDNLDKFTDLDLSN